MLNSIVRDCKSQTAETLGFCGFDSIAITKGVEFFPGLGGKLRIYYFCIIKSNCSLTVSGGIMQNERGDSSALACLFFIIERRSE